MIRVPEKESIAGKDLVKIYDETARRSRKQNWTMIKEALDMGMSKGKVLSIGSGPAYIEIDLVKKANFVDVTGLDVSREMTALAHRNIKNEGVEGCIDLVEGDAKEMPLRTNTFDAVLSDATLHHISDPIKVFNEIHRVLKDKGKVLVQDPKRDADKLYVWIVSLFPRDSFAREGFKNSIRSAYTKQEVEALLSRSMLRNCDVKTTPLNLTIICPSGALGIKEKNRPTIRLYATTLIFLFISILRRVFSKKENKMEHPLATFPVK